MSGDGRRLFSGSDDETVRVWDVSSGEPGAWAELPVVEGHTDSVNGGPASWARCVFFSQTSKFWVFYIGGARDGVEQRPFGGAQRSSGWPAAPWFLS